MMSKFIEVHDKNNSAPISVNVEHVVAFENGDMALREIGVLKVTESYDEVKTLIHDAGVLIHKADPRLDTTTPLTMEDLKYMEGESVWNSNTLKWMLIHRFVDADKPIVWLVLPDGQFKVMTVDDLIKTPLYRMVQR